MPGLGLDLNLDPDLKAACRRLSFRGAYSPPSPKSPPLPTIDESSEDEPAPPPTSPRTTVAPVETPPPTPMPTTGAPVATSLALALPAQSHSQQAQDAGAAATKKVGRFRVSFAENPRPVPGETPTPTPTVGAPVANWLALAPPAQSQSQQAQEAAAAATRMLEQRRHEEGRAAFAEYQRPATGGTLTPTVGAPVATWLALAPPAQSQSQQAQEAAAAAATRMSEQRRHEEERASFAVYQQQRQQALAAEAGLQQALAAQQESQQLMLFTVDGRSASYETKWDELHPVSQGLLLQIEDRIREHRDDSEQLDQCRRFDDLSLCNMCFQFDASQITQEAVSISTFMNREKNSIESLMTVIKEIMLNTEFAMNSYVKLRPRFVYPSAESANSGFSNHSRSSGAQTDFHQLLTMTPRFRCYSSTTRRPSPFVQQTVARFEDDLGYCCKLILELEQLVQMKDGKTFAESLESLSNVMSNVHDYLIHLASKVEHFHQYVETVETQYLYDRRRRGDLGNPFLNANKREAAKQEATNRIIHPMSHQRPPGQPTMPVAAPMVASQPRQTSFPTVATTPISYPTIPLPSVFSPSSPQTNPAPLINPFGSSRPFDSFSTHALGSLPSTSLFRTGIPSAATSLFPVPSGDWRSCLCTSQCASLIARGRPPRDTISDLDCGGGSCEEASAQKSATGAGQC